jgi:2-oxoglutarate ferredoxin oxidoreductase subunit delta
MQVKNSKRLEINKRLCKSCGICIAMCPKNIFTKDEDGKPFEARPEECVFCGMCESMCPDFAIRILEETK